MAPTPFNEAQLTSTKPLRVGFFEHNGMFNSVPSAQRAVRQATERLRGKGHTLVPFEPPEVLKAMKIMNRLFFSDNGKWMEEALDGKETPHKKTAGYITYKEKSVNPATE